MNPETIFAIIAYAIGMVYICRRYGMRSSRLMMRTSSPIM